MQQILTLAHAGTQVLALLIGLFAFYQGIIRITNYFKSKKLFYWKKHVKLGTIAIIVWLTGALGFAISINYFGMTQITGLHADLAIIIIALSFVALITGYIMNKYKKKRKYLPILHGTINTILILLVLYECYVGYTILFDFI